MSFLLDTNIVSEWVKPTPSAAVVHWIDGADEETLFLCVVTFAELRHGIERLPVGRRRRALSNWLEQDLTQRFEGRILDIGLAVANRWGTLMAHAARSGRTVASMDGLIAATAAVHSLTLVTRNTRDFAPFGIDMLDPWRNAETRK